MPSQRATRIGLVADIPCHFQADYQLDIAREARRRCLLQAGGPVGARKLRPFGPELLKRSSFVVRAAVKDGGRSALNWHSFAISNLGIVSETVMGESDARIAIGR